MKRWLQLGATVVAVAAGPGLAQEAQVAPPNTTLACSNGGVRYAVGEYACIPACHGQRRMARCDTVAEQASWTYVSDACPSVMILNPPWPSDWSEIPVVADMTPKPVTVNLSAISAEIAPRIGSHWPAFIP